MNGVRYLEAAQDELLLEVGYLELRVKGLGRRFLGEVRRVEQLILQFPRAGREIRPGIRRRLLRKFPFSLIYSLEGDDILILAVAHHKRRPGYWLRRSGGGE